MVEKFGFEHSDDKIESDKLQEKTDERIDKAEASGKRKVETVSAGFEKVDMVSLSSDADRKPDFEKDMFVIREKVTIAGDDGKPQESIRIYFGENELQAKKRQSEGWSIRDSYDYDQHDWAEEKDGKIQYHVYDVNEYKSTGRKAIDELGRLKAKIIGGKEETK